MPIDKTGESQSVIGFDDMATPLLMEYLLSMHLRLCSLAFVAIALAACDQQSSPPPATTVTATPETPSLRPATPPPVHPITIAAPDASTALAELTQAVRRFSAERRKVPLTLEELTAAGYLKSIPTAPAGKRFVINPKTVAVTLE